MPVAPSRPAHQPSVHKVVYARKRPGQQRRTVLYQGGPGSGKTHCALSWPKPVVLYCEENVATLERSGLIEQGRVLFPGDWGDDFTQFRNSVVPLIKNRKAHLLISEYDENGNLVKEAPKDSVETIVLDAVSSLLFTLERKIIEPYAGGKIPHSNLAPKYLYDAEQVVRDIVSAVKPLGDEPCYHIVCTTHLKDITDSDGNLVKTAPAIYGQMRDFLTRWFDSKFLCRGELKDVGTVDKPEGGTSRRKDLVNYIYTKSPDKFHDVSDGVGGEEGGSKYRKLPFIMEGTYQALIEAWGMKP